MHCQQGHESIPEAIRQVSDRLVLSHALYEPSTDFDFWQTINRHVKVMFFDPYPTLLYAEEDVSLDAREDEVQGYESLRMHQALEWVDRNASFVHALTNKEFFKLFLSLEIIVSVNVAGQKSPALMDGRLGFGATPPAELVITGTQL